MRALGALVLAVADECRLPGECPRGDRRVEVELDHLPVALVLVVEVVEDVEEPVLQRELAPVSRVGRDPRIGHGSAASVQPVRPLVIRAAGCEGVAGKVEVVAPEPAAEIGAGWSDLEEIGAVPRPAQHDVGIPEHEAHVGRHECLAVSARLCLFDETDDRCVPIGELTSRVGGAGGCRRRCSGNRQDADRRETHRYRLGPQGANYELAR